MGGRADADDGHLPMIMYSTAAGGSGAAATGVFEGGGGLSATAERGDSGAGASSDGGESVMTQASSGQALQVAAAYEASMRHERENGDEDGGRQLAQELERVSLAERGPGLSAAWTWKIGPSFSIAQTHTPSQNGVHAGFHRHSTAVQLYFTD